MQEYGFAHVWNEGDDITRAIAIVLLIMSVLSWAVILYKFGQLFVLRKRGKAAERFWQADTFDEAQRWLGKSASNPYAALVAAARETQESEARSHLAGAFGADEWLRRTLMAVLHEQMARLQNGVAILASVGSTSPFVGLFGTVWGIYHALLVIGSTGQSSIDKIAGPVGEALVMTAFGLFVAIPAVLSFNMIARGNKAVAQKLMRFAHDLEVYFMTGTRHKPQAAQRKPQQASGPVVPMQRPSAK
jgi:biopolymer transport protein ExbB